MKEKLDAILHIALQKQATDIHFVSTTQGLSVTMRCEDGVLPIYSAAADKSLFNYLKYIAHLDLGLGQTAQSGNFQYEFQGECLQFRFALLSTLQKQTAVLRILNNHTGICLETLSDDKKQQQIFHSWCQARNGLIVLSGPTGSGKTTTLHAMMQYIAKGGKQRVVSLEDPIEIVDGSYLQLQINEQHHFSYEEGIKELLRHDPDVIMIGEIRDPMSARMLMRSALSGHLIFTSVHAKSCLEVIYRLHEFGLSKEDLRQTLTGITSQRLFHRRKGKGRVCIYEALDQNEIITYFKQGELPSTHENMEMQIASAIRAGTIQEEAQEDFLFR